MPRGTCTNDYATRFVTNKTGYCESDNGGSGVGNRPKIDYGIYVNNPSLRKEYIINLLCKFIVFYLFTLSIKSSSVRH